MGFASAYIEKRALFPEIIKEAPDPGTGIIVVVPSFAEPGIATLLDSLSSCYRPDCKAEVIIVINAPLNASAESIENNRKSIINIERWRTNNISCFFRLYTIDVTPAANKGWGVGSARKAGMDEAARRFDFIGKPDGVILNLDADCRVDKTYFTSIYREFCIRRDRKACSVYFEHPLSGDEFPEDNYKSIALYELHLRYYYQGLNYSGFPYVFHTIGSVMGVKALPYVKAGGMNRREAGEDFYFIQKLLPMGGYFNLTATTVYPSSRSSFRVPFGTGTIVAKLTDGSDFDMQTYNVHAFMELKSLFGLVERLFFCDLPVVMELYQDLPGGLRSFLSEKEWTGRITEIKNNTSGLTAFRKRFFTWFNMFRVVKYMNSVHQGLFTKCSVAEAAMKLLGIMGLKAETADSRYLLLFFRNLEKQNG